MGGFSMQTSNKEIQGCTQFGFKHCSDGETHTQGQKLTEELFICLYT